MVAKSEMKNVSADSPTSVLEEEVFFGPPHTLFISFNKWFRTLFSAGKRRSFVWFWEKGAGKWLRFLGFISILVILKCSKF